MDGYTLKFKRECMAYPANNTVKHTFKGNILWEWVMPM